MIRDFNYYKARSVKEALSLLDKYKEDTKIICGGQSLLILMRQGLVAPKYLIDIKRLDELSFIEFNSKTGLRIGATTTHSTIEKSSTIKKHYPILTDMEANLASVQTRNWGTIGGNLAHGDPTGDPGPVLLALNASVKVASLARERILPLGEFFVDYFETSLEDGELLCEIQVPIFPKATGIAYEKFNIIKNHQGIVSAAASVTVGNGTGECSEVRLVLGAAAAVPLRVPKAEAQVIGKKMTPKVLEAAASAAAEECEPIGDIHATEAFRRDLVKVLTKRTLKKAWKQAAKSTG